MAPDTRYEDWIISAEGGVAEASLNRPQALNAQRSATFRELHAWMDALAKDASTRVLILRAEGRAFSAGADLKEYAAIAKDERAFRRFQEEANAAYRRLSEARFPVIACLQGPAFGGGLELALHADVVLASAEAKLGLPEPKVGLIPGGGGVAALLAAGGLHRVSTALLTGEPMSAAEGHRLGIVSEVTAGESLLPRAREIGARIAACAPLAIAAIKRLLIDHREGSDGLARTEGALLLELFRTADAKEGVRAFAEKRKPAFRGE